MITMKRLSAFLVLFMVLASNAAFSADNGQKLFVNLTSDEMNRAAMAIGFSTKMLQENKVPVTIFLNVDGVRIADKNIAGNKYANGKSLKEMLAGFMKAGGSVIVCPMCMKNVGGLSKDDLIDGVKVGGTWAAMSAENTIVVSY